MVDGVVSTPHESNIQRLSASGFARLLQEPRYLKLEAKRIDDEMERLSVDNYGVHVRNQECLIGINSEVRFPICPSRLFLHCAPFSLLCVFQTHQIIAIKEEVGTLETKLPAFSDSCSDFLSVAEDLVAKVRWAKPPCPFRSFFFVFTQHRFPPLCSTESIGRH